MDFQWHEIVRAHRRFCALLFDGTALEFYRTRYPAIVLRHPSPLLSGFYREYLLTDKVAALRSVSWMMRH